MPDPTPPTEAERLRSIVLGWLPHVDRENGRGILDALLAAVRREERHRVARKFCRWCDRDLPTYTDSVGRVRHVCDDGSHGSARVCHAPFVHAAALRAGEGA